MRIAAQLFDKKKNQNKDEQKSIKVQIKFYSKLPVNERETDQKPRAIVGKANKRSKEKNSQYKFFFLS